MQVKGLSTEKIHFDEAGSVHRLEGNRVRRVMVSDASLVRGLRSWYADDFVICVQYKDDAEKMLEKLKKRLGKYGLELAEDKTRRIEFGRFAKQNAQAKGTKPATFNFLGFTHYIDQTRTGKYKLGRKTDRNKLRFCEGCCNSHNVKTKRDY
jgi:hypothetical protein